VIALAAAGLVLFSGATVTSLAAWSDTEWVNGGVGTVSGLSSSSFDVEQNVTTDDANWKSNQGSPGGVVDFGALAARLTPGTSVVGFVRLRTAIGSDGGTLTVVHGASTGSAALLGALRFGAWLSDAPSDCTTTGYDQGTTQLVADGTPIGQDPTTPVPFTLLAGSSSTAGVDKTVCFRLTFPPLADPTDTSLQGLVADPVWQFNATSN
jgi:hypothetical protein